jgi:tRNA pseudouridine38-40 synthase
VLKYAIRVSYFGKRYCGWQKQKGSAAEGEPSIQEVIEKAVEQMTGEQISLVGSGRTDSGVHAVGQVAHFVLKKKEWNPEIIKRGLNSILRSRIQVLECRPVSIEFHAQRSAIRKQYSYYFQQGPCAIPHLEPVSWWIHKSLDVEAMNDAIGMLVGEHDFKSFQASGAKPGSTVRKILEADVNRVPAGFPGAGLESVSFVRVRVLGTGFLKQMVRGIAGTLLQVGEGRRDRICMQEILETKDRSLVGPTAPARALWLEKVWYPSEFGLNLD